eukprot:392736-Hanusia_phi.AAC.1
MPRRLQASSFLRGSEFEASLKLDYRTAVRRVTESGSGSLTPPRRAHWQRPAAGAARRQCNQWAPGAPTPGLLPSDVENRVDSYSVQGSTQ